MFMLLRGQRPVHPKYSIVPNWAICGVSPGELAAEKKICSIVDHPATLYDVHAIRDISFIALFSRAALCHIYTCLQYMRIYYIYIYTYVDNNNRIDI